MANPAPTFLLTECPKGTWRQYQIITDERCVVVEMVPALLMGWKFYRIDVQDSLLWPGYTMDSIVAWKLDGRTDAYAPRRVDIDPEFSAKLAAIAGVSPIAIEF